MALSDGMLKAAIGMLGITPQQVQAVMSVVAGIGAEMEAIRRDRESFKKASGVVLADITARLDRIEEAITAIQNTDPPRVSPQVNSDLPLNGVLNHV